MAKLGQAFATPELPRDRRPGADNPDPVSNLLLICASMLAVGCRTRDHLVHLC